jgi:hypothetical protein
LQGQPENTPSLEQISSTMLNQFLKKEEEKTAVVSSHYYIDPLSLERMLEFDVDASEKLLLLLEIIVGKVGGDLRVPLIFFGYNNSIYKHFL